MIEKKHLENFESGVANAVVDMFDETGEVEPARAYKEMTPYEHKIHTDSIDNAVTSFKRNSFVQTRATVKQHLENYLRKEYNIEEGRTIAISEEDVDLAVDFIYGENE